MKMKRFLRNALVLSSVVGLGLSTSGCMTSSRMEKAIKDYLEKNPQALKAQIEAALKSRSPQQADTRTIEEKIKNPVKVDLGKSPIKGTANAPIMIVEFSEFQCPFCARVEPTLKQLLNDYKGKIGITFRHNPLPFHKNAMSASKAALAGREQGKFWEMHEALFNNQKDLSDENILKLAKQVGLNSAKFKTDWKSNKFDAEIEKDMQDARSLGASGTPSFFINGVSLRGAQPVDSFKAVIDKILAMPSQPQPAQPQPAQPIPAQPPVPPQG